MNPFASTRRRGRRTLLWTAGFAGLVLAIGLLLKSWFAAATSDGPAPVTVVPSTGVAAATTPLAPSHLISRLTPSSLQRTAPNAPDRAIWDMLNHLRSETDPEQRRLRLANLRAQLMKPAAKTEAGEAIVDFLRSGEDATTGWAFRVGPMHALAESPTLRTALLDWLGQIDSRVSADYSTHIFATMSSPEEYAVALRNFARGRPEQREELRNHFNRLLTHTPWASQPTAGYVESFDVIPYLADPAFVNTLSPFLAVSAPASLRHASMVALDRLVLANPGASLPVALKEKALEAQPLLRASFIARADVRDPEQEGLVERYLLSPSLSDLELDKFLRLFPNANRFASHNLLTVSGGPSLANLAALDAAALERVRGWQTQPRFSRLMPRLKELESRLREHVGTAIRGGYLPRKD